MCLHESHDALGLERLGAFAPGRVGVPEEDEVGDVEVEAGSERGDELVPLPHCVGADAVDEEEGRFGWGGVFGDPAVDDGALAEIGGGGLEAGGGEGGAEAGVARGDQAEAHGHF